MDGVLEGRLMEMVIGLDMQRSPGQLLKAIKLALVVKGILRIGGTERATPAEPCI